MVNLNSLTVNCLAEFRSIANDKNNLVGNNRRDRILALEPILDPRYTLYQQHFAANNLDQIPKVIYTAQQKEDLQHCYTVETNSLSKLIAAIKDNQPFHIQGICQFCGMNTDSTTDHYLPKGGFPDYCVNALNLLPCCPDCNSLKGEYMWDAAHNTRGIINLYTDNIPNAQFLYANVTFNAAVPVISFILNNANGINAGFYAIVERHFTRLDLLSRYKGRFNSVYNHIYKSFHNKIRFSKHPNRVRDFLLNDANELFADYGRNYYVGIVMETLANNQQFISQF